MKRRILSAVMALVLCLSLYPAWVLAEESAPGSCPHHRSHTPECGYQEAEPGQKCTHEHTEDCYRTAENCIHEHGASCYPEDKASEDDGLSSDAEEKQPTECSHLCSEDSGCVTKELDCRHEHDENRCSVQKDCRYGKRSQRNCFEVAETEKRHAHNPRSKKAPDVFEPYSKCIPFKYHQKQSDAKKGHLTSQSYDFHGI